MAVDDITPEIAKRYLEAVGGTENTGPRPAFDRFDQSARPFTSGVDIDAVHWRDAVVKGPWPPHSTLADEVAQALALAGINVTVKPLPGGGALIERKP